MCHLSMRLGCFGGICDAIEIEAAGFDFLEAIALDVLRGEVSTSEWAAAAPDPDKLPLPIEAANCLLPREMPVIGPDRDMAGLQKYIDRVTKRARMLGIRRLVFGSSGARRRPDGVDPETASRHLREFTRMAGEACAGQSIVLVIEHLHSKFCNTLNKLAETKALCDEVALPNVGVLVDNYQFALEKEDDRSLLDLGQRLKHIHLAEPVDRVQPGAHGPFAPGGKSFDFEHFFVLLHRIGYTDPISVEARWNAPIGEAGAACVSMLRQTWERAAGRGSEAARDESRR